MLFLWFVELLATIVIMAFVVTQIAWPIARNQRLFPAFRRKAKKLQHEEAKLKGELDDLEYQRKVDELKQQLNRQTDVK